MLGDRAIVSREFQTEIDERNPGDVKQQMNTVQSIGVNSRQDPSAASIVGASHSEGKKAGDSPSL
jgi:hypothetical protein